MKDFFAVVFCGDRYHQYKLSDILANSISGFVNDEYAFQGIRFYLPLSYENNKYYLCPNSSKWEIIDREKITDKHEIKNGDFILSRSNEHIVKVLFIDYSTCCISSKQYMILPGREYYIGRSDEANIRIAFSDSVSRKHAYIKADESGEFSVFDQTQTNGVYVNGRKIDEYKLKNGDCIFVMGISMSVYQNRIIIPDNVEVKGMEKCEEPIPFFPRIDGENEYYRTPRIWKSLSRNVIEIECPPRIEERKDVPFILTGGPTLTLLIASLVSMGTAISKIISAETLNWAELLPGIVTSIVTFMGSFFWPYLSRKYNEKLEKTRNISIRKKYIDYLAEKEKEISQLYERNTQIWNESLYPNCQRLINYVLTRSHHLWERSYRDDDFLEIRLGQGDRLFEAPIEIKNQNSDSPNAELNQALNQLVLKYKMLKNVPITVSLNKHKVIGVIGDYWEIAGNIIANLASLYAPEELKIVLVFNQMQKEYLDKYKDLPHLWSDDKTSRYMATTSAEAFSLFTAISSTLQLREEMLKQGEIRIPHYAFLVFDQSLVEGNAFKGMLLDIDNRKGVSSVFFGERFNQIPKECEAIIQRNAEICGIYVKHENDNKMIPFTPDVVSDEEMSELINGLSSLCKSVEKSNSAIPSSISFMDMYHAGNVGELNILSHWNRNEAYKSLAAPIGVLSNSNAFYLDIHEKYHGCHGLVAGTTGSGKSEFLQAYILSMMVNFSPNEVAFVLIDFKGGDMARPFLHCPHLAASISNLSVSTLYRALISLEAEVKNRQKLFNQVASELGIDKIDINSYQKMYKDGKLIKPLPHLIIIIDEFAQLKTKHSEFLEKLIDIAQVGRSLGIHLILATQKPSGVVDPQIWSNTRFKVCLKVADKQDSNDMIGKPVAASIKMPGRAFVQVGYDEIFEQIQSGYSGAPYICKDHYIDESSVTVNLINGMGETIRGAQSTDKYKDSLVTQIEAITKKVIELGNELEIKADKLWCNPLPERVLLDNDGTEVTGLFAVKCGLADMPWIQSQRDYLVDFLKNGHIAIYGSAESGKSTFVQTILYAMAQHYSNKEFVLHAIDFNGGSLSQLSYMPHCLTYSKGDEEDKIRNTFDQIEEEIIRRQQALVASNCSNYSTYVESHSDIPIMLVVIDNYALFRDRVADLEDRLVNTIEEAGACGIFFIITGTTKGAIYYKIIEHIKNKVVFNMTDDGSYRDILDVKVPVFPDRIKGRAVTVIDGISTEIQIAVPFDCESEVKRKRKVEEYYKNQKELQGSPSRAELIKGTNHAFNADIHRNVETKNEDRKLFLRYRESGDVGLGLSIDRAEIIGIDTTKHHRIFVGNRFGEAKMVEQIYFSLSNSKHLVRVYSTKSINIPEKYYVSNIDEYVDEYGENDDILIIDGFSDFYDEISDEKLDLFSSILEKQNRLIFTFDDMSRLFDYVSCELYLKLVKGCDFSMFIGGKVDDDSAVNFNEEIYSIPEEYRNKEMKADEGIVICDSSVAYIHIGEE